MDYCKKKWMSIVEICWGLSYYERMMQDTRREIANRKVGKPKKYNIKLYKMLGISIPKKSELSDAYTWEFNLECMQYYKGSNEVLKWCREHLKTKKQKEYWQHPLREEIIDLFKPILNDKKTFIQKMTYTGGVPISSIIRSAQGLSKPAHSKPKQNILLVSGNEVFENPFNFIQKYTWMWNAAIDYCLRQFNTLDIRGAKAIAFKAMLDRELNSSKIEHDSHERELRRAKDYMHVKFK